MHLSLRPIELSWSCDSDERGRVVAGESLPVSNQRMGNTQEVVAPQEIGK